MINDQSEKLNASQVTNLGRIQESRNPVYSPQIHRRRSSITTLSLSRISTARSSWRHFNNRNERQDSRSKFLCSDNMESLYSQISEAKELCDNPQHTFVPERRLQKVMCEPAVKIALQEHRSELNTDISTLTTFNLTWTQLKSLSSIAKRS